MAKVILICGLICSGKTCYAKQLLEREKAVLLSTDEATFDLIDNAQGPSYDAFARRVNLYLRKKAAQIAAAGANVILDWGFWSRRDRQEISAFFAREGVPFEWHYVAVEPQRWQQLIRERNARIAAGDGGGDFYLDEGLLAKLLSRFQEPEADEMDVWYRNEG